MARTQSYRFLRVTTPLGEQALLLKRLRGVERIGSPFVYELDLFSEDHEIEFEQIVGRPVTIHVDTSRTAVRHFSGYVSTFEQVEAVHRKAAYRAVVVPWLWFLTRTADCRVYSQTNRPLSVPEILREVFDSFPLSDYNMDGLSERYDKKLYCVQYRETAFNFAHRLMEEEGISYYFRHAQGRHTLMLCDSPSAHAPAAGFESVKYNARGATKVDMGSIWAWKRTQVLQPGRYVHSDYDFFHPSASMRTDHEISREHATSKLEFFDYPGRYYDVSEGERLARVRLEEFGAEHQVVRGEGDSRGLEAGRVFKLEGHPRQDQNEDHLLTAVEYEFTGDDYESGNEPGGEVEVKFALGPRSMTAVGASGGVQAGQGGSIPGADGSGGATAAGLGGEGGASARGARAPMCICRFTATRASTPFRPMRITPRPFVQGPQTATVVGNPGDEIHTDAFGRVKVHFHWDRHNAADSESSSCWIRVSHAWAGGGWGAIYTPRVGQEVVVEFIEGDPDRPMITGRVYNDEQRPPTFPVKGSKTVSTMKSHSSKGGGANNFNELKFEDKKGEELMSVQAEKDRTVLVKHNNSETVGNNETVHVGHDRSKTVDHDETTTVKHDRTETVGNNETITIGVNRTEAVGADETITIGANRTETVGANETVTIGGMHAHTTALASAETVGLAKALSIGAAYQVSVGAMMNETVGGAKLEETGLYRLMVVGGDMKTTVGGDLDHGVSGKHVMKAKEIVLDASTKIFIQCGASKIILQPGKIEITAPVVKINC